MQILWHAVKIVAATDAGIKYDWWVSDYGTNWPQAF